MESSPPPPFDLEDLLITTETSTPSQQGEQDSGNGTDFMLSSQDITPSAAPRRRRNATVNYDELDDQRKRHLERNRVAASKSRQKKKKWVEELEQKSKAASGRNQELNQWLSRLREESMFLRSQLLAHENCDCTAVHTYLRQASANLALRASAMDSTPDMETPMVPDLNMKSNAPSPYDWQTAPSANTNQQKDFAPSL
ncbi:hypothetical protein VTP01DRAFT_9657 [Rhizomucor pusillus]|uniref:uncharacterized protein n=1 Tax=Rhizomucor pusillus TaxID=4840 RepID=UPI0037433641